MTANKNVMMSVEVREDSKTRRLGPSLATRISQVKALHDSLSPAAS